MTHLDEVTAFLDDFLETARFPHETNGVRHPTSSPSSGLGWRWSRGRALPAWAETERLDAVLLHRAAHLEAGALGANVGVLGYHLPLDEKLMLGWNLRLSDVLGLTAPEVIGWKQGRPLGMIGNVPSRTSLSSTGWSSPSSAGARSRGRASATRSPASPSSAR